MTDWQPIETAPLDQTIVLVHPGTWNAMTASPAFWDCDQFASKNPRPYWRRLDTILVRTSRENTPTHWMPIPEKP